MTVKPEIINGKYYVELLSYGEKQPVGHALQAAKEHFRGRPVSALEIGVLRGHNAINIYDTLTPYCLVLVDPWGWCAETHANNWADVWFRIQDLKNVRVLKATSEDAATLLGLKFDYIYLDGDHAGGDLSPGSESGGIRKDIELWWPRVHAGGILAGHDYNYENINLEVNQVFGDKVNSSPYHPNGGMEWWVFKGAQS
jgi:hypothetical protein